MEVFKNEVGRPSNETLKKRKIIIGSGIALGIAFVITLVFIGGNLLTSSPTGVTTSIGSSVTSSSKLVINSRKVKLGRLFGRDIYGKEYYVDRNQSSNVDVEGMSNRGKINWRMVTLLRDKPVGTGYVTFHPAIFSARYYCYTWDLDGNIVYSNSIYYWG